MSGASGPERPERPGASEATEAAPAGSGPTATPDDLAELRRQVAALRAEVAELRQQRRFAELEVERLNVVEPDGTLRLVVSNRERAPDAVVDGQAFKRQGGNPPGLLFYNDEGDECGGLFFSGKRREDGGYGAGAHLLFDQFKQDQAIGIQNNDSDGERSAGLFVSDWVVIPGATRLELIARWQTVRALPPDRDDPTRRREQKALADALRAALVGRRVLEVACGTGYWTQAAAAVARHVTGVDAAPEPLAVARAKPWPPGRVALVRGDA